MKDDGFKKKLIVIGSLAVILLIFMLALNSLKNKTDGDVAGPEDGAFLEYKNQPFLPLDSVDGNDQLKNDLAYYARKTLPNYGYEKQPGVVFTLTTDPIVNGMNVSFKGKFKGVKDNISVSYEKLNNERIKTSVKNDKTGKSIDSELPSNSARNIFISSLPINTTQYSIVYNEEGSIDVNVFNNIAGQAAALDALKAGLKTNDLSREKYNLMVVPATIEESSPPSTIFTDSGD